MHNSRLEMETIMEIPVFPQHHLLHLMLEIYIVTSMEL